MSSSRIVVVTGATGFVGAWLCRSLAEEGYEVRAVGRRPDPPPLPGGVVYYQSDLLDEVRLRRALAGADTVVHLAARVHVMRETTPDPLTEFRRINLAGTEVLLREAIGAGAARFVFASTVKVLGDGDDRPLTALSPPAPADSYGVSKLEAEAMIRRLAVDRSIDATILRLPLVYGPGMKGNMLRLFRLVDSGMPLPLRLVRNRRSFVFVGNVAEAVRAILVWPAGAGRTFLVSDGRDVSTPELLALIAAALGRRARLLPVPPAMFRLAGRLGDALSRIVPLPLTSGAVDRLLGSLAIDSSALVDAVGFRPRYSMEEGLRITAEWYRAREGTRR